jgi:hypothetical protein
MNRPLPAALAAAIALLGTCTAAANAVLTPPKSEHAPNFFLDAPSFSQRLPQALQRQRRFN